MKSDPHGGAVGYDAAKRIKGRKRHLLVDTLGLLLGVHVTPASTPECAGARVQLARVLPWPDWPRLLWSTAATPDIAFAFWVRGLRPELAVTVVKRSDKAGGSAVLARRSVVERTFGRLMRHRRLVRHYGTTTATASAETIVLLAMIRIQIRRLA